MVTPTGDTAALVEPSTTAQPLDAQTASAPQAVGRTAAPGVPTTPPSALGWEDPIVPEVLDHEAWAQQRHDLEMRTAAVIIELERALAEVNMLLGRYDDIRASKAAFRPPIRTEDPVPPEFARVVRSARERLHASRPDLFAP